MPAGRSTGAPSRWTSTVSPAASTASARASSRFSPGCGALASSVLSGRTVSSSRRSLDDDERDVVRDDVVELAGDAGPLLGDGALRGVGAARAAHAHQLAPR